MRGLLAIVVAFTMISCATVGTTTSPKFSDTYTTEEHSDDYTFGWNYVFPFEDNGQYYIIVFYTPDFMALAIVAPINFFVHESEIVDEFLGTWVWSIKYQTDQNNGYEMGVVDTPEEAVEAANDFMDKFIFI